MGQRVRRRASAGRPGCARQHDQDRGRRAADAPSKDGGAGAHEPRRLPQRRPVPSAAASSSSARGRARRCPPGRESACRGSASGGGRAPAAPDARDHRGSGRRAAGGGHTEQGRQRRCPRAGSSAGAHELAGFPQDVLARRRPPPPPAPAGRPRRSPSGRARRRASATWIPGAQRSSWRRCAPQTRPSPLAVLTDFAQTSHLRRVHVCGAIYLFLYYNLYSILNSVLNSILCSVQ